MIPFPRPSISADPEPLWRHMLGDRLRRVRHARDETLTETAQAAGVSPQYLSEIERGLKEPSSEIISAVAGALDTSLLELTTAVADELRAATPTGTPARAANTSTTAFALAA